MDSQAILRQFLSDSSGLLGWVGYLVALACMAPFVFGVARAVLVCVRRDRAGRY